MAEQSPQRLIVNAFTGSGLSMNAAGLWRIPGNRALEYTTLQYWLDLAKQAEAAGLDALFISDVLGMADVYRGSAAAALASGAGATSMDPLAITPAMAAVTERLGFVASVALTYEQPYSLARRFSTLDHITGGRIGWNVVTSYQKSAAINLGSRRQIPHDDRYEMADEFLEVCYKLWEGSWEDGAVVASPQGAYADPGQVRPIQHRGKFIDVPGIHLVTPSAQRTPFLYQAGASSSGRALAAKHAEAVFTYGLKPETTRRVVDDIKMRSVVEGRPEGALPVIVQATVIVGSTDEEAQRTRERYEAYADHDGALAVLSSMLGIDLAMLDPDQPVEYVDNDGVRTALAALTKGDPDETWTARRIAERTALGGIGPVIAGSPETVADELERWNEVGGVDGFNLVIAHTPDTMTGIAEGLMPELRRRGRVPEQIEGDTFRGRMNGSGQADLPEWHPGRSWRGAFRGKTSAADGTAPSALR